MRPPVYKAKAERGIASPDDWLLLLLRYNMFCLLLLIFHTWALAVEGGAISASAEALGQGGANNNGAAGGNNGAPNGAQANTKALLANLVQIGGYLFLQPVANGAGQASVQPLIPLGVAPQTATFVVGQPGGANVAPLGQITLGAGTGGGPVTLLAVLPQGNNGAAKQLLSAAAANKQQQAAAVLVPAPARLRARRSLAARLLGTRAPATAGVATTAVEEEDDWSGMEEEEEEVELEK